MPQKFDLKKTENEVHVCRCADVLRCRLARLLIAQNASTAWYLLRSSRKAILVLIEALQHSFQLYPPRAVVSAGFQHQGVHTGLV